MSALRISEGGRCGRLIAAVALAALAATACEKTAVATSVSPCFRVLPDAHAALGGQGQFVDVARRKGPAVYPSSGGRVPFARTMPPTPGPTTIPEATEFPNPGETAPSVRPGATPTTLDPNDPRRDVCIVAYRGTFDPSRIPLLRGPARSGQFAVVVVGVRTQKLRAVILTDRLPPALHRH
ncbi:MAG: hypothetical protein NVS3B21_27520 [Acidimicrobiales bacterium]